MGKEGTHNKSKGKTDYDSLWKDVLEEFWEEFILFISPTLYQEIDFSQKPQFLEQELRRITRKAVAGKGITDKLVKNALKNGQEQWLLVHVEVQGSRDSDFSFRMFRYFYRIFDRYGQKIYAVVLFTDNEPGFNPGSFVYTYHDTSLTYAYKTYKILEQDENELIDSENPFALAVLAGLYTSRSKGNPDKRYLYKLKLARLLLNKKWDREKIEKLFIFLDGILHLPAELSEGFAAEVKQITSKGDDVVGLTWDKSNLAEVYREKGEKAGVRKGFGKGVVFGVKQGVKQGVKINAIAIAKKMLADNLDIEFIARYTGLPAGKINKLRHRI